MRKKILLKTFILIVIGVILFFPSFKSASALEITYPSIPFAPEITANSSLFDYIYYFFVLAVISSGIIGVMVIVISGLQILLYAGNPESVSESKKRILGSVLGIVLLMLSVIILRTINPELITPSAANLGTQPGNVYLTNDDGSIFVQAPDAISNMKDSTQIEPQFTKLFYDCPANTPNGQTLLVWVYNKTNWIIDRQSNGSPGVTTITIPCGSFNSVVDFKSLGVLSFKRAFDAPGVYLYLKNDCEGISSAVQTSSGDTPSFDSQEGDDQTVRSMRINIGTSLSQHYVVVLNKTESYGGECSPPIIIPNSACIPVLPNDLDGIPFVPKSEYIINQNPYYAKQRGVTIYSDNIYVFLTEFNSNPDFTIKDHWAAYKENTNENGFNGTLDNLLYKYHAQTYTTVPPENYLPYECTGNDADGTPEPTCINGIQHNGNYYTIMYAKNDKDNNRLCKVYPNGYLSGNQSGKDLGNLPDLYGDGRLLYRTDIIPSAP